MVVNRKIKNTPKYIIFWAVSNYLTATELEALIQDFIKGPIKYTPKFLDTIARHFDIERFRTDPVFWQDIWLYNYIKYDIKDGFKRNAYIVEYENLIMKPTLQITAEMKAILEKS